MGYAAARFGQYQPMAQGGMMGAMMGMPAGTLAQPGLLCQGGMPAATPYVAGLPGGGMGIPSSMVGGLPSLPQQMYGVQPAQQLQWNITQVRGTWRHWPSFENSNKTSKDSISN